MDKLKLIKELEKEKSILNEELERRKNNINSNYELAKLDFVVIENLTDSTQTFSYIIEELEKLQKRIIKRNKGE